MKKLLYSLLVFGFATQLMFSQEIELPDVYLNVNYKYLNAVDSEDVAIIVKRLEEEVAFYNIKESPFYDEDYDSYSVSFFIPEGKIVAAYNEQGQILRTIERFKNVSLPQDVANAIFERFPNWTIIEDAYKVNYFGESGHVKKQYKVKLKNGDKKMNIKLDEKGEFL